MYRLRHFPTSSHEYVVAAWIPLCEAGAVVSHEIALEHGVPTTSPERSIVDVLDAGANSEQVELAVGQAQDGD